MAKVTKTEGIKGDMGVKGDRGVVTPIVVESNKFTNANEPKRIENSPERKLALKTAFDSIVKQFGNGSVMKLGDKPLLNIDVIPTGCLSLDAALGVGGVPRGRIIEIFGPEMSGKTTLCLHLAASCQKLGGNVAIIDAEHALDLKYAKNLGVNIQDLILSQPDYGEQALTIAEEWVKSGAMDLIVIDSVAALVPRSEIEGEMGDSSMGVQARLMSQALRKLTMIVGKSNATVIFTNQLRSKIGVVYGNPEVTTGGNALKFYASVRLDVRRTDKIEDDKKNVIGNVTRIRVIKNKVAPPFRETTVNVLYGSGFDIYGDLVTLGVSLEVITKAGAWYSYKEDRLGQGTANVAQYLKDNPKLYETILSEVRQKMML